MSWVPSGSEVFSPPKAVACTANAIAWHAEHTPDAIAVFDNERAVTWRALACDLGGSVARAADLGRRGSLIGVETGLGLYRNLLAFLACEVIGATSTPFRQSDLCNDPVLDRCDARLFDGTPPPQAYSPRLWDQPPPDGIARISRTSGSTGATKAVPTTFATLQRILVQRIAHLPDAIRPAPRLLCAYNLGIRSIYIRVCATLLAGGTVFLTPPERTTAVLASGAVNWIVCLAGDAEGIASTAAHPGKPLLFEMIGARITPALRSLVHERLGAIIQSNYASNETNSITFTDDDNVGTVVPGAKVRIVDADGVDLPLGECGRILAQTSTMASGYWNDPERTAAAFVDGWYRTDDFGVMPAPGTLVVLGRADGMLNIGGIKLPVAPLEDQIRTIQMVTDAVVFSDGDDLVVAVECPHGPPQGMHIAVRSIVSRYVRAVQVMPMPAFPRTETGKPSRRILLAQWRNRHTIRRRQIDYQPHP